MSASKREFEGGVDGEWPLEEIDHGNKFMKYFIEIQGSFNAHTTCSISWSVCAVIVASH